jgi:uncharacterized protein (TIGR02217 family)
MVDLVERLRDDIAAGLEGGHNYFDVTIVSFPSGNESRNLDTPVAKGRWNAARAIEFHAAHAWARAHFMKARGMFRTWRMKDYFDYEADRVAGDINALGRLVGSGTIWQMSKVYGVDEPSFEYVRPLHCIVPGTDRIWVSGALQVNGVAYTLDDDTGIVTSASTWNPEQLEMACEFDVPCRYDTRGIEARHIFGDDSARMLIRWENIDIVEVREVVGEA